MIDVKKSIRERIFHAISYELIAVLFCAPLFSWILNKPVEQMGVLNIAIAVIAMSWNMLFNAVYDRLVLRFNLTKKLTVRILHGITFEGGLTVLVVPVAAWWLNISLWQAFLLDVGILLFFLPYTVAFNWVYDELRLRYHHRA
jgi:uncharacterized membrane protein